MSSVAGKGAPPKCTSDSSEGMVCEDALMRSTDGTFDRFSFCVPGALVLHVTDIKIRALFKRLECNVLHIQP